MFAARVRSAAAAHLRRALSASPANVERRTKVLTHTTINPHVVAAQYAVRGELVLRATKYQQMLAAGEKLPFSRVILCNIGNPQSLRQKPLTFVRQVMALCEYPQLLESAELRRLFPSDAINRAMRFHNSCDGLGAYSHSMGVPELRKSVAEAIERRDGHEADANDIYLTNGASPGIQRLINMLVRDRNDGIMIPIPQYPLYSAAIALTGGQQVDYFLEEEKNWALNTSEMQRSLRVARDKGTNVRALVVINPNNPTGSILSYDNIREVIEFCAAERLVLLADEVYQENIYSEEKPFVSFFKVLRDMGSSYSNFELASFHSVSKGFLGECGHRGGFAHLVGFEQEVQMEYYKLASLALCSNLPGQVMVELMMNPPRDGDESHELYARERDAILQSLKRRALKLTAALDALPGMHCNPAEAAMYAFPRVDLSAGAVAAAKKENRAPDAFYCLKLLDATGICVVPGSGFGQRPGTHHFRTTFLPPESDMDEVISLMKEFHTEFMNAYQ